ncbi:SCO7613 C-terminal domain-containing membrane protein [Peribacillus loiseleuriae]|uniref:SCO7613 C-terminal domain-containing membrane protein n=1 Tax=Peribacillus loiseleuriae TaxID=1679170 RepID=UPI00380D1081
MTDSNDNIPIEKKREIFHGELKILREKRLIPKSDYIRLSSAYERHYHQLLQQTALMEKQENKEETLQSSTIPIEVPHSIQRTQEHVPEPIQDPVQTPMASPEPRTVIQQQPIVKPAKTAEQIRERNITLVLVMGVILLLFGGLILATSTWGALNAILKVFCISMVSVFFCGMAFIAFKLKIKQTAFAFLTLASLFIPIAILSASYYRIFGEYLSLQGEGRGLLGLIGGAICLGIYFVIAKHFTSKLFTLLSLITFALASIFGFTYVAPTTETLFILLVLFNLLFLWYLDRLKSHQQLILFKPYLFYFIQFKIFVEAFVVFVLASSTVFYSFTLLLASLQFLLLTIKYNQKYYNFAFSIVFSYGYIHLVLNSAVLSDFTSIAFAVLPIVFIALYLFMAKRNEEVSKSFVYTGVAGSVLVFAYVNAQVLGEGYAQIFFALILLAAQYVFLAIQTKKVVFTYPAIVLFNLSLVYLGWAFGWTFKLHSSFLFVIQILLYLGLFVYNFAKTTEVFRTSIGIFSSSVMLFLTYINLVNGEWLIVSLFLAAISGLLFFSHNKVTEKWMKDISTYGFPLSLAASLLILYLYISETSRWYDLTVSLSLHVMIVASLLIGLGYFLQKSYKGFFNIFFITGQVLSMVSFMTLYFGTLQAYLITALMVVSTAIQVLSVYLYRHHLLWVPVVYTSFGVYASIWAIFKFENEYIWMSYLFLGPLLFYVLSVYVGKYSKIGRNYFFWFSHLSNLLVATLGYLYISMTGANLYFYLIPLSLYAISAVKTTVVWERFTFTYVGFTALQLQVLLVFQKYGLTNYLIFAFTTTAALITILWSRVNPEWKRMIDYYLLVFLNLTLLVYLSDWNMFHFSSNLNVLSVMLFTIQAAFAIYLMMKRKWEHFIAVPLLLAFLFYVRYASELSIFAGTMLLFVALCVVTWMSKLFFHGMVRKEESYLIIDVYRIVGFLYVVTINWRIFTNADSYPALEIIAACLVSGYLLVIRAFTLDRLEKTIYLTAAVVLSLYPYYVIIDQFNIPNLVTTEVTILPLFIISTLLLRKVFDYGNMTQTIELVIVPLLFIVLIIDALQGNTVNDALIIGMLALVAIIFGFIMKYKSYFLAGTGTILLNIYMNTKHLWGNLPWWLYLIIGGIVLIALASFFEWKKQKENTTSKKILERNKEKIRKWFERWR